MVLLQMCGHAVEREAVRGDRDLPWFSKKGSTIPGVCIIQWKLLPSEETLMPVGFICRRHISLGHRLLFPNAGLVLIPAHWHAQAKRGRGSYTLTQEIMLKQIKVQGYWSTGLWETVGETPHLIQKTALECKQSYIKTMHLFSGGTFST